MLNIGCHLSVSKGFYAMGKNALKIDANTFQFFTRNPRGSKAKDIDPKDVEALLKLLKENNFTVLLAHAPYTLNPCSADEETRLFAMEMIADDLKRMEYLPNNLYNFHPGNHMDQGVDAGIKHIITMLNTVLKPEQTTTVLLETMSGKGTEIGRTFEELKQIIDGIKLKEKVGFVWIPVMFMMRVMI
jgi:Endonuclease IV (EC 3.1.21.-)